MEKVKLTKEQARAIQNYLFDTDSNVDAVIDRHCVLQKNKHQWEDRYKELNDISMSHLSKALYVGYEIELEYKSFIDAIGALQRGKTIFYHGYSFPVPPLKITFDDADEICLKFLSVKEKGFLELIKGKWTIEA